MMMPIGSFSADLTGATVWCLSNDDDVTSGTPIHGTVDAIGVAQRISS
jgi:hypothetical protein